MAATWGVPAHVTVIYPFAAPDDLNRDLRTALRVMLATFPAFDCAFTKTAWFGQDVLWLEPTPAQPFRDLTKTVWSAFPDYPPYAGAHGEDLIPHLTVGERAPGISIERLRTAEQEVQEALPVRTTVDYVWLMVGARITNSWRLVEAFQLQD